jgi:hypothetical protein
MPNRGGTTTSPLTFTRRALQGTSRSLDTENEGVNPHKFYRGLRAKLTQLRGHSDPPYEVIAQRARDLRFDPEAAGEGTGAFTARLQGRSQTRSLSPAQLVHRPWAPQAAGLVALGVLVACFGLLVGPLALLGLGLTVTGAALFTRTEEAQVPLERRDVISVLVEGEARESVRRRAGGRRCKLTAEMGVLYAGDVFLTIPPDEIDDLDWALRAELANRATRWEKALEDGPPAQVADEVATGFVDAFRAWALLDGGWTRRRIRRLQREVRRSLAVRQAHTELLAGLRATHVRGRELDRLGRELETLANEMSAYAERERLPGLDGQARSAETLERLDRPAVARPTPREAPLRPRPRSLGPPAKVHRPRT